jgi:hypothetical protein
MAKDYLLIPATLAPSKLYLVKVAILSPKRGIDSGDSIRMIVCLKAWGIFTEEDTNEDTDDEDA